MRLPPCSLTYLLPAKASSGSSSLRSASSTVLMRQPVIPFRVHDSHWEYAWRFCPESLTDLLPA